MPRSHFNRCSGKQIFLGSSAEETRSPDTGTRRRGAVTSISRNTIQKFEYLLVGELALDHLTLSNRSADYINNFASIHVGIALIYWRKSMRHGVVRLAAAYLPTDGNCKWLQKNPNAWMWTDRRQTRNMSDDDQQLLDRLFNDCFN